MKRSPRKYTWPSGEQVWRFEEQGRLVDVAINWDYVRGIARQAMRNKTQHSGMGPVQAKVVKP